MLSKLLYLAALWNWALVIISVDKTLRDTNTVKRFGRRAPSVLSLYQRRHRLLRLLVTLMTFYPRRNLSGRIRVGSVSSTRKQTALLSQYLWAKLVLGYTSNFHTARSFKWDASRRNVLKCGVYWRCDTFLSLQRICFFYEAIFLHGLNGHLW